MSRKPHAPDDRTRAQVEALIGFGIQQAEIADYLQIDLKTLRKYYRHEITVGGTKANVAVIQRLYKAAVEEGSVPALIYWTKAKCGWREKQVHEITSDQSILVQIVRPDEVNAATPDTPTIPSAE